ncbi:MAG TPA: acetylxylan esterase [Prolixibacteraceae bacterium]|nr:acetylxylan esterase [Prolixibacteraceae bacterium]
MNKISAVLLILLLAGCGPRPSTDLTPLNVTEQWAFATGDDTLWAQPSFDDAAWARISVTKTWEEQGFPGYDGFGWYRQTIDIPVSYSQPVADNGGLVISYANADDADELWFNGTLIGSTGSLPPDYVSKYGVKRRYVVPAELVKPGEKNLVAIRVFDGGGGGGVVSEALSIHPMSEVYQLPLTVRIADEDWVFVGAPKATIGLATENQLGKNVRITVGLKMTTDDYQPVSETSKVLKIKHDQSGLVLFDIDLPAPGFYRCTAWAEKEGIKGEEVKFNIGYEPEKIVSPVDTLPGFAEFWKTTRAELDQVKPDFRMTLLKEKSGTVRDLYQVTMQSFGNVTIEGFYAVPKVPGKYPVIISYMGYGSDPWLPGGDYNPDFAEFVLSTRGQGIQKAANTYGDWILHGLDSKENYYYRGAFMDLVRAIDFVVSRPEVDPEKIVAEGGSQGGAFTLAACALDHRIKAAAPTIPFLSDYPDYFKIAPWPASAFVGYLKEHPEKTWDEIYPLLSFFDVKNLAPMIRCPILMAAGLQDDVCPPHTNFAAYNQITSEKKYYVFPDQGHSVPQTWNDIRMAFFREKLGLPQL